MSEHNEPVEEAAEEVVRAKSGFAAIAAEEFDVMTAIGGWRGVAESVTPTIVFLVLYAIMGEINLPAIIAVVSAVVFIGIRALQRIPVAPALGGLFAIALSAFIAWRTGEASDFFAWGLVTNVAYLAGLLVSIAMRWPAMGLLIGFLRGDATGWREDPTQVLTRRRYVVVTWMWAGLFAARLLVQAPLYFLDATGPLGIAKLAMGVPLFALVAWFSWLLVRDLPPTPESDASQAK